MTTGRRFTVVGLMSGTSMDGIDAAVLETDGDSVLLAGAYRGNAYPTSLRRTLLRLPAADVDIGEVERAVTDLHAEVVRALCTQTDLKLEAVDLIGFHGQTIRHEPEAGRTWQLGDGQRLADALGCTVVNQFRQNDLDHGGQGAPLAPAYHRALIRTTGLDEPVAVLNIGGVSNVTLVDGDLLYACDCGPGNALIDDWVGQRFNIPFDEGGQKAAAGQVNLAALTTLLESPAAAIALEAQRLPGAPGSWIVVGGGRRNLQLLRELRARLKVPVQTAEDVGWSGDAIEAQAFGYLAVRSALRWPLSWPGTTGVSAPVTGGVRWQPSGRESRIGL